MKKRGLISVKIIIIAVIVVAIIVAAGYFLFVYTKLCGDEECFFSGVDNCKRVSFYKEDSQSVWLYSVKGTHDKTSCDVSVGLVKIKQGTVELEKLQGREMNCIVDRGSRTYPEQTLSGCNGMLKEGMQEIIIQRMHNYILQNIGEVKQGFSGI
ncbi:Uncharacterised protein [uncultured archaeon]|nr:Uncharacterised protein [uncultured archaeon]